MEGTTPLYDYCPCCGVEFGYQDATLLGARNFRAKWLAGGAEWASPDERPSGWHLEDQMEHVPSAFQ